MVQASPKRAKTINARNTLWWSEGDTADSETEWIAMVPERKGTKAIVVVYIRIHIIIIMADYIENLCQHMYLVIAESSLFDRSITRGWIQF